MLRFGARDLAWRMGVRLTSRLQLRKGWGYKKKEKVW